MLLSEVDMTAGLKEAVAQLRANPEEPVTTQIDGLVVEIRRKKGGTADDIFQAVGRWQGESAEELTEFLAEARRQGGSKEPPKF